MIDKVDGPRVAGDANYYLIALWKAVQLGWRPPERVTKEQYAFIRKNKYLFPAHLVGFVGFGVSFGAKFFGGYARVSVSADGREKNHAAESARAVMRQAAQIKDVTFMHREYNRLPVPPGSIIYCDPPYAGTTTYKNCTFEHGAFWQWCRDMGKAHRVYISEYAAPSDFKCVFEFEYGTVLGKRADKPRIERLFVPPA